MARRLIDREQDALEAIINYMKDELNQRIDYANGVPKDITPISQQVQTFWDKCTHIFKQDVSSLSIFETDIEDDSSVGADAEDDSTIETDAEEDPNVELMEEGSFGGTGTEGNPMIEPEPHSSWQDAMEVFKRAYLYVKREYCISKDQESQLDENFERLCKRLEGKPETVEYSVLGSIDFAYLPYMLNLQNEAICALLPYLLTSYTFNFWNSRYFNRRKLLTLISATEATTLRKAAGLDPNDTRAKIDSSDAAKKRYALKDLAKVFTLEDCEEPLIPPSATDSNGHPVPFCVLFREWGSNRSYVMHKEVLDYVFDFWCKAVSECAPLAEEGGFPLNIDFKSCKELYSGYTHLD